MTQTQTTDDFDEQHLRRRGESDPRARRWTLVALLVFWVMVAWVLTGCQTIHERPRLTAAAAGVVVTSIALSAHKSPQRATDAHLPADPPRGTSY